jgi:hypothetical protein
VAEKKFPVGPLPRTTIGKDVAKFLWPFAESFRPSAKPGFPVVEAFEGKGTFTVFAASNHFPF